VKGEEGEEKERERATQDGGSANKAYRELTDGERLVLLGDNNGVETASLVLSISTEDNGELYGRSRRLMGMAMVMVNFFICRSRLVSETQAELQATQRLLAKSLQEEARAREKCEVLSATVDAMKSAHRREQRADTVVQHGR
jgi:hypothetical protein